MTARFCSTIAYDHVCDYIRSSDSRTAVELSRVTRENVLLIDWKKPILNSLWGLREGFTIITPQTWTYFDETSNISVGNFSRGSAKQRRKVFCFLSPIQRSLSDTYPAPISTMFEQQTWIGVPERTSVRNFRILRRGFASPEKVPPRKQYFGWGVCYQRAAQTAQFQTIEIILGVYRLPKDVPFVYECWWGLRFGRYDPQIG